MHRFLGCTAVFVYVYIQVFFISKKILSLSLFFALLFWRWFVVRIPCTHQGVPFLDHSHVTPRRAACSLLTRWRCSSTGLISLNLSKDSLIKRHSPSAYLDSVSSSSIPVLSTIALLLFTEKPVFFYQFSFCCILYTYCICMPLLFFCLTLPDIYGKCLFLLLSSPCSIPLLGIRMTQSIVDRPCNLMHTDAFVEVSLSLSMSILERILAPVHHWTCRYFDVNPMALVDQFNPVVELVFALADWSIFEVYVYWWLVTILSLSCSLCVFCVVSKHKMLLSSLAAG